MPSVQKWRFSIRFTLFSIFVIATTLTAGIAIFLQFHFSTQQAKQSAFEQFQMSSEYTRDYLAAIDHQASELTELLSTNNNLNQAVGLSADQLRIFAKAMEKNPLYYSIFIGQPSGHFGQLINLNSKDIKIQLNALASDRWLKIDITPNSDIPTRTVTFLDENLTPRISYSESHEFDPTSRPWFKGASHEQVYKSAPYQFKSLEAPGLTYSKNMLSSEAVLGVDIALSSLSKYLKKHSLAIESDLFVYQATGEVIATNNQQGSDHTAFEYINFSLTEKERTIIHNSPTLQISNSKDWSPIDFAISGQPRGYSVDKLNLIAQMTGLELEFVNGFSWPELVGKYKNNELDGLQAVYNTQENKGMGILSIPFLELPYATVTQSDTPAISHIDQLKGKTLAIAQGWSIIAPLKKQYPEINLIEVDTLRDVFMAVKNGQADAGIDSHLSLLQTQSQFFIEGVKVNNALSFAPFDFPSSLHLLIQPELQNLIPIINRAISSISESQEAQLQNKWLSKSGILHMQEESFTVPHKILLEAINNDSLQNKLLTAEINDAEAYIYVSPVKVNDSQKTFFAIVTSTEQLFAKSLTEVKVSIFLTAACLVCLLPLSYLFSAPIVQPIQKLMAQNKKIKRRQYDDVTIEHSNIKELDQLGASLAEMSASIKQHEKQQAALLESFVELIAQAIDDKSPYTAGHCKRVPDIGIRLAEAASSADYGVFSDFNLKTAEQKREFKMAAWLHDCGKITTPEYIVDKATKLETIYNRIHEIRMRFEVLYRDAVIEFHQNVKLHPESEAFYKTELERKLKQFQDDFAFIAKCNQGGEYLSDEAIIRLENLSVITWERHFDDKLGLSQMELEAKHGLETPLPCVEMLLSDKTEHIQPRTFKPEYAEKYGIKMDIPDLLTNKGELYNLTVSRGTLTQEDRFRINEHMISTIKMLDSLPFPDDLANVPRWASTHHETLIGTGYPRKLFKDDLSIPERILVVADIFEALTASDRPYKKAKTLSESLKIMQFMVKDQHIDPDVFELFLTSGVYLDYAKQHLAPTQIDNVDIDSLIGKEKVA
ncbi:HD domain-containing phosphohydrolase [Pseudoalteromonas phenolica]|uniref:HD domain-containing phosphohydrolase n=1 Tax=Pseudoalteromonas phenolica TaxID=161398 RepID=UPI00110A6371|nr:HD domain-containing phosphohydrolase [Pseudoalteromonas phenolica]TMO57197.1 phosphohydrolase [Pseudoalteromonas phenolica]